MGSIRRTRRTTHPRRNEILREIAYFEDRLAEIGPGQTPLQHQARLYYLPFIRRRRQLLAACTRHRVENGLGRD